MFQRTIVLREIRYFYLSILYSSFHDHVIKTMLCFYKRLKVTKVEQSLQVNGVVEEMHVCSWEKNQSGNYRESQFPSLHLLVFTFAFLKISRWVQHVVYLCSFIFVHTIVYTKGFSTIDFP